MSLEGGTLAGSTATILAVADGGVQGEGEKVVRETV